MKKPAQIRMFRFPLEQFLTNLIYQQINTYIPYCHSGTLLRKRGQTEDYCPHEYAYF